jgi:ABC-type nitrate/sulfonate/bicarbonate transport system substrate-binding protein
MVDKSRIKGAHLNELPVKFDISPLLTGQIDVWPGYSINEPISAEEQGFQVNLIAPNQYGLTLYADVLFTTEEMIRTQPEVVKTVVQATVEGWENALQKKDQAIGYTLKYGQQLNAGHEMKMLNTSVNYIRPDNKPIGFMDAAVWQDMQNLLIGIKFMEKPIDVSQAYRVDFLPGARP